MFGYLAGTRLGALTYNLSHTTLIPGPLAVYGLKDTTRFKDTHLGRV